MRTVWTALAVVALGAVLIVGIVAFPPGDRQVPFLVACAVFAVGTRLMVDGSRRDRR
ncbi:hypothetical protein [Curtobacterium sp. ISL-83]|uniref:hypothetical protein n=1 Tax=Curtobacterium sp. ISL-83 TaxID=2819145 RepID=UPI001BEAEAAE|nr:hypothetical protein [Curtobacterium sp. ISL-83]MBT2502129.1 hypothetical protein [Curtobacterium sp. ISL-83]